MTGRRSPAHVEPRDIEILLELTEVGAGGRSASPSSTNAKVAYSESNTPELKISFAMTEPEGLNTISGGRICIKQPDVPWDFGICPDHLFRGRLEKQISSLVSGS
jgi:hypothetical protein